jgi:plasmid stability protein
MGNGRKQVKVQQLNVRVPTEVHAGLRMLAAATETSINDIVLGALRNYLSEEGHRKAVERFVKQGRTLYRAALDKLADL